jgi:hypothetical protein
MHPENSQHSQHYPKERLRVERQPEEPAIRRVYDFN